MSNAIAKFNHTFRKTEFPESPRELNFCDVRPKRFKDAKHKLIAAADVTNEGTDYQQLANVALEAKANLALTRAEVAADAGYYNAAEVSRCVEQQITPYIPKSDTSANMARGLYGKSQFTYDATANEYMCPAGAMLTYRFSTYELGRELQYYRAARFAP